MKGCFSLDRSYLSLRTEWILFLPIIFVLCISFIAYIFWVFLNLTLHTFPNPPLPITYWQSKWSRDTSLLYKTSLFSWSSLLNFERSILKQFLMSLLDFFDIVELLLLCSFYFLVWCSFVSWWWSLLFVRPDITTPVVLLMLIFLNMGESYLECWPESCWLWMGILMGSTLGLLPLWELRRRDLVGMVMGMERLIFLKKLLTIAADDLRGSYLLEFLLWISLLLAWLFIYVISS